jgi:ABC-type nickel/cobalt efflux system permease component RcnA
MTTAGWVTMIASVGGVTFFFVWCIWRVVRGHKPDHGLAHIEPVKREETEQR